MVTRCLLAVVVALVAGLRTGHASAVPAQVEYHLTVANANSPTIEVELRLPDAPAEFRLAMATHTEYDDQYWRYVTGVRGASARGAVSVTRESDSVWKIVGPKGDVSIRYSVAFPSGPPMQQSSWKGH